MSKMKSDACKQAMAELFGKKTPKPGPGQRPPMHDPPRTDVPKISVKAPDPSCRTRLVLNHLDRNDNVLGSYTLQKEMIEIGSREASYLRIENANVADVHAIIKATRGHVILFDRGSAQGTFVDGRRFYDKIELFVGEIIEIGDVRLKLDQKMYDPDPQPQPAPGAFSASDFQPDPAPLPPLAKGSVGNFSSVLAKKGSKPAGQKMNEVLKKVWDSVREAYWTVSESLAYLFKENKIEKLGSLCGGAFVTIIACVVNPSVWAVAPFVVGAGMTAIFIINDLRMR